MGALSLGASRVDSGGGGCHCKLMLLTPKQITRLSPAARLRLIGQLWDSLTDADVPLPPAQRAELERRLLTLDQDRVLAVPWEHLEDDLARRCP